MGRAPAAKTYTMRRMRVRRVKVKTKLTVNVDKELILRARVCAHSRGVSLSQLIELALR